MHDTTSNRRTVVRGALLALGLLTLAGCATPPSASDPAAVAAFNETNDRLEPLNRTMFKLDQGLDAALIRPVAWSYNKTVPDVARKRVSHVLDNVISPVTFINDLLQGEGRRAAQTFWRLVVNTTVGLGGMFDVADSAGVPQHTEDFGQTLAVWGVGDGTYLYLPLLGPSSIRDGIGLGVDAFGFDPIAWYSYNPHNMQWVQYAQLGAELIDAKANIMQTQDELKKSSIDYYAALRSAYRQYRAKEIRNGAPLPPSALPNMDSEGDPFAEEPATKSPK